MRLLKSYRHGHISWSKLAAIRTVFGYSKSTISNMQSNAGSDVPISHVLHNPASREDAVLYVHWPYCEKRCSYCNFNKYIKKNVNHSRMQKCLSTELCTLLDGTDIKKIHSVFFGGGTPSLAQPQTLAAVVETLSERGLLTTAAEVTLEANPTALEASKLRAFKDAGITRVSLGIQSLNDHSLLMLGRQHDSSEALSCLDIAKDLFPGHTSVDLIFGLPGQSLKNWQSELEQMISLCDDHISLYQLTLERGTQLFKQVENGKLAMPDADVMADMYELAVQFMEDHNFVRYEASNFARNGARSSHNQAYWQGMQYIGIGPGAHGRFYPQSGHCREARIQTLEPDAWMYEVERYGHGTRKVTRQSLLDVLEEILMAGLRTAAGIKNEHWHAFGGSVSLMELFGNEPYVKELLDQGFLNLTPDYLRATKKGLNVVDQITPQLMNILHDWTDFNRKLKSKQA